tara:strand:+ start:120591 stop:120734 length:144 start_codon:yes stop_codon:yes gene_type:complete
LSNELDEWVQAYDDPGKSLYTEKEFEAQKTNNLDIDPSYILETEVFI